MVRLPCPARTRVPGQVAVPEVRDDAGRITRRARAAVAEVPARPVGTTDPSNDAPAIQDALFGAELVIMPATNLICVNAGNAGITTSDTERVLMHLSRSIAQIESYTKPEEMVHRLSMTHTYDSPHVFAGAGGIFEIFGVSMR